jgi:hypothetical protein
MLLATFAVPVDGLKFLLLVLVGGGLLALGRWSSRLGPTISGGVPSNGPTPDTADLLPGEESKPKIWPPSAEEVAASLPLDPALGNLRIRKFYFKKADAIPGPDDPEVFADELNIELYDTDSGMPGGNLISWPLRKDWPSCCARSRGDICTRRRFWSFLATTSRRYGAQLSAASARKMNSLKARSRRERNRYDGLIGRRGYFEDAVPFCRNFCDSSINTVPIFSIARAACSFVIASGSKDWRISLFLNGGPAALEASISTKVGPRTPSVPGEAIESLGICNP